MLSSAARQQQVAPYCALQHADDPGSKVQLRSHTNQCRLSSDQTL